MDAMVIGATTVVPPFVNAKLVHITSITMVYGTQITKVFMGL